MTNSSWPALLWHHGSKKGKGAYLRTPSELVATLREKPLSLGSQPSGCLAYHTASDEHITQVRFTGTTSSAVYAHFTSLFCKMEAQKELQLTLEHGLGLRSFGYTQIFFHTCTVRSALYIPGFRIHESNRHCFQSGWESGCGGPTVCHVLHHFT